MQIKELPANPTPKKSLADLSAGTIFKSKSTNGYGMIINNRNGEKELLWFGRTGVEPSVSSYGIHGWGFYFDIVPGIELKT